MIGDDNKKSAEERANGFFIRLANGLFPDVSYKRAIKETSAVKELSQTDKKRLAVALLFAAAGSENKTYTWFYPQVMKKAGQFIDKISQGDKCMIPLSAFYNYEFVNRNFEKIIGVLTTERVDGKPFGATELEDIISKEKLYTKLKAKDYPAVLDLLINEIKNRQEEIARAIKSRVLDTHLAGSYDWMPHADKQPITYKISEEDSISLIAGAYAKRDRKITTLQMNEEEKALHLAKELGIITKDEAKKNVSVDLDALARATAEAFVQMVIEYGIMPEMSPEPKLVREVMHDPGFCWGVEEKYERIKGESLPPLSEYGKTSIVGGTRPQNADAAADEAQKTENDTASSNKSDKHSDESFGRTSAGKEEAKGRMDLAHESQSCFGAARILSPRARGADEAEASMDVTPIDPDCIEGGSVSTGSEPTSVASEVRGLDVLLAAQSNFLRRFVSLSLSLDGRKEDVTEQEAAVVLYGFLRRLDLESHIECGFAKWKDILDAIPSNEWIDAYNGNAWFSRVVSDETGLELCELQSAIQVVLNNDFLESKKSDADLRGYFGCPPDVDSYRLAEGVSWVFSKIVLQLPFYSERRRVGDINLDVAAECLMWLDLEETLDTLDRKRRTKYQELLSVSKPVEREVVEMGVWHDDPIRWLVVEDDREKTLLVSEKVVDIVPYDSRTFEYVHLGWEDCGLRKWLNEDFFGEAFNEEECARIIHTSIEDASSVVVRTGKDKVADEYLFCLSAEEFDRIFENDFLGRLVQSTSYAKSKGSTFDYYPYDGTTWWLRTPTEDRPSTAYCIGPDGSLTTSLFNSDYVGVRPAVYIKKQTEEGCRFGVLRVGDCCTFGEWGEQLSWLVLDIRLNKMLLVTEKVIDCLPYDELPDTAWANSSIRRWLNDTFLRGAFNDEDRSIIANTAIVGENEADTSDKVFLLSEAEAMQLFEDDEDRSCLATLLANSHGTKPEDSRLCYWWLRSPFKYDHDLKSPVIACVDLDGSVFYEFEKTCDFVGIRPAIWVNLD